ncbi:MAG: aspartate aminotransferase family protein [Balneola sp.]|jgi:acetylornithine/N-succinyldiaminopimelate aminotransferase|nr:aspartate aminotransferase family protein [Balneola sp.]MBE78717.1 aspartate aminotransferase family protein [Balneola sp.]|tara:strand:+ start:361 stop:1542 length:1182 start_codon:yes stop_codon:yes gene_type:complete
MDKAQQLEKQYHFQVYNRLPVTLSHGKGALVWDTDGNEYLDAFGGLAVNNLGHAHPKVVAAIKEQADKMLHASNFFYNEPQSLLAEKLAKLSGLDRVFFCNSGVESMEACVKLARKWGKKHGKTGNVITLSEGFHGRSVTTIAMGMQSYREGFDPMPTGFEQVPFNDFETLKAVANKDTIAIGFETIQGSGGVNVIDAEFLHKTRQLCDELNILMIIDEVQCGIGRSGKFYAYQHFDVKPDIVATAKALAGGIPIGAIMAKEDVASALGFGDHGTTFGGNPFSCHVANAALDAIEEEGLVEQAAEKGAFMMNLLKEKVGNHPSVKDIRGLGLMLGVELDRPARPVIDKMFEHNILGNAAHGTVVRFLPPLVITNEQIKRIVDELAWALEETQG